MRFLGCQGTINTATLECNAPGGWQTVYTTEIANFIVEQSAMSIDDWMQLAGAAAFLFAVAWIIRHVLLLLTNR